MEMSAEEVLDLYNLLEKQNIWIWIDGGWAVDAMLGVQTRSHGDLDIAVQHKDLITLEAVLKSRGYQNTPRDEEKMWNLVLANFQGKEIEVHAFSFDTTGVVIEEKDWNGYSKDSLGGMGIILNQRVRCVSLNQLVKTHDQYKRQLKETDYQDMVRLSEKFGVTFPSKDLDKKVKMIFTGVIQKGKGEGVKIGFPTANIELTDKTMSGIYAGRVWIEGKKGTEEDRGEKKEYIAALFADQERKVLEAHLLDFEGDLYGKEIEIELFDKIRDAGVFESVEALKAQIAKDVETIRALMHT